MVEPVQQDARGIVQPDIGLQRFTLTRHAPDPPLDRLVDRFWEVRWDLPRGERHEQHVLMHPVVNVVLGDGPATVSGVQTRRFTKVLEGRGHALGVMFRPAGFRALLDAPLKSLTDRVLPVEEVLHLPDPEPELHAAQTWLRTLVPARPHACEETARLVERVARDRSIVRVDQLATVAGTTVRTLQRRFADHVGIGPKWVIRRYRLYDAAELAARGDGVRWARLAADLGYADQAHLGRECSRLSGRTPSELFKTAT